VDMNRNVKSWGGFLISEKEKAYCIDV